MFTNSVSIFGILGLGSMNRTTFLALRQRPSVLCARRSSSPLGRLYTSFRFFTTSPDSAMATVDLSNYDSEQARLMKEQCILVDENDESLGAVDKKDCESVGS